MTTSGTLALALATQAANRVWAGPASGAAATPTFRALVAADIPSGLAYLTSINSDTTAAQALSVGTSGTDFAITNPGSGSHVFNLPTASASNRGALSSTDWSTFNGKQAAGNYITALTGDGTAAGPGSAALTLATVNSNVGAFTYASITVNAKGLVTAASSGSAPVTTIGTFGSTPNSGGASISSNTLTLQPADGTNPGGVSTTTQTIAGAKTFSNVVAIPAGAVNAVSLQAGTAGTGLWFPTAASIMAFSSGGAESWRTNASGIAIGTTAAQTARLYIAQSSTSDTGIVVESGASAGRKVSLDFSGANTFMVGRTGTNGCLNIAHTATGGTGANWWNLGLGDNGAVPAYPGSFVCTSANGNVTALSSIKSLDGATINGAPWVVTQNLNTTANTIVGWVTTGSSKNPMSFVGTQNKTNTAASEVSDLWFATQKAGTLTLGLKLTDQGQLAIQQSGAGLSVKEGSNCKMGTSTLVGGTVTVSTTAVTTNSRIFLTTQSLGTVAVPTDIAVTARTNGTSFVITSASATDTSVVAWMIVEPS